MRFQRPPADQMAKTLQTLAFRDENLRFVSKTVVEYNGVKVLGFGKPAIELDADYHCVASTCGPGRSLRRAEGSALD